MTSMLDFHQAIERGFAARFVQRVAVIAAYNLGSIDPINTPAILIELDRAQEGDDRGDDRIPVDCTFNALCILSVENEKLQQHLRAFAAEVFSIVRRNRWGLAGDVGRPEQIEMGAAEFKPGENGYDSWYVSWSQTLYMGPSRWDDSGVVASKVFLSQIPNVGTENLDSYEEITSG